jgi:hypothetical protein
LRGAIKKLAADCPREHLRKKAWNSISKLLLRRATITDNGNVVGKRLDSA